MSIKSVAIQRYSKSIFDVVGINKNFIKIKEPDGSITSVRRDDDNFTVLLNATESEINRFIGCIRPRIMPKEVFERPPKTWNMTYEEYKQCYCPDCQRTECYFYGKGAIRARIPKVDGGLGLCLNLTNGISDKEKSNRQLQYLLGQK